MLSLTALLEWLIVLLEYTVWISIFLAESGQPSLTSLVDISVGLQANWSVKVQWPTIIL